MTTKDLNTLKQALKIIKKLKDKSDYSFEALKEYLGGVIDMFDKK